MKITADPTDEIEAALRSALAQLETDALVTIGVHEGEGAHDSDDGAAQTITNAQLGAVLDEGDERGHIPPRPWLRPGVQSSYEQLVPQIRADLAAGRDPQSVLERAGAVAAAAVQQYIVDLREPENAPSTIASKKSSNPLIDTGELRQAVGYQVQESR